MDAAPPGGSQSQVRARLRRRVGGPGFRLTAGTHAGADRNRHRLFPGKLAGIQAAFRLTSVSDSAWQATVRVERLPQTVQADGLHLFSIGEGIAYGSSVINYVVSGAPVAAFKVELSDEYYNVEFTGKDIRNWQKTNGGYVVQLHTPGVRRLHVAGHLRAAVQGAGRDAGLHRRASRWTPNPSRATPSSSAPISSR